jgi:hypothetical protein
VAAVTGKKCRDAMKYHIIGWVALVSLTIWVAPYVYGVYEVLQWR